MLRSHEDLLLKYFRAKRQFTNAVTEGMDHKTRVPLARGYGYRSFEVFKLVPYHAEGNLPEPPSTHRFHGWDEKPTGLQADFSAGPGGKARARHPALGTREPLIHARKKV